MARPLTRLALTTALALFACGYARSEHVTFSYSYSLATITSIPEHGTTIRFTSPAGGVQVDSAAAVGAATPVPWPPSAS
jgi:hypothetical protein